MWLTDDIQSIIKISISLFVSYLHMQSKNISFLWMQSGKQGGRATIRDPDAQQTINVNLNIYRKQQEN